MTTDVFVGDNHAECEQSEDYSNDQQCPCCGCVARRKNSFPRKFFLGDLRLGPLESLFRFLDQIAKPTLLVHVRQLFLDDREQSQRVLVPLGFLVFTRQSVEGFERIKLRGAGLFHEVEQRTRFG